MAGGFGVFGSAAREITIKFAADVRDIAQANKEIAKNTGDLADSVGDSTTRMSAMWKSAGKAAAVSAAAAATAWALEGSKMALEADRVAASFADVTAASDAQAEALKEAGRYMGLANHESQQLVTSASMLAQTMGMSKEEANAFSAELFEMAGNLALTYPELTSAEDAFNKLLAATNGQIRGLKDLNISISANEIAQRAANIAIEEGLDPKGKEARALATLELLNEKTADSQGKLNSVVEEGNATLRYNKAAIDDVQVAMGRALQPIKQLAIDAFMILADVLIALEPLLVSIGELLYALMPILDPVIKLIAMAAEAVGFFAQMIAELIGWIAKAISSLGDFMSALNPFKNLTFPNPFRNWKKPSFHSGGVVPGAAGTIQPVLAQGGETIGRPGQNDEGAGTQTVINISVQAGLASPYETAREITDLLQDYAQQIGGLPVEIRQ